MDLYPSFDLNPAGSPVKGAAVYRYISQNIAMGQARARRACIPRDAGILFNPMDDRFEALKNRLREIRDRLDPDEQAYFGPLIENFSGGTSEFQRIMRDLGKFGAKIADGSKFEVYRQVQHLFEDANRGK